MKRPDNLQKILAIALDDYLQQHKLDGHRLKVCRHILNCRTPALGGVQYACDHCHHELAQYHSCRDRHCPQCQQQASRRWSNRQQQDVLPVTYYHLIFTLPHELNGWIQLHPKIIYALLFKVAWSTLKVFAADPKRLGGKLGMTAVLHTWGQSLTQHVHLHCLVPGGVLTDAGTWNAARSTYLFPVQALSRVFRGKMISELRKADDRNELSRITHPSEVDQVLNQLMSKKWVIYAKPSINRTQTIINYLARYTHRIAISDHRIIEVKSDSVIFKYRDYRTDQVKPMRLELREFIRRFMLHVLPPGFMRVRHYGLLANRCRKRAISCVRAALLQSAPAEKSVESATENDSAFIIPCQKCHAGHLWPVRNLSAVVMTAYFAPS